MGFGTLLQEVLHLILSSFASFTCHSSEPVPSCRSFRCCDQGSNTLVEIRGARQRGLVAD